MMMMIRNVWTLVLPISTRRHAGSLQPLLCLLKGYHLHHHHGDNDDDDDACSMMMMMIVMMMMMMIVMKVGDSAKQDSRPSFSFNKIV